MIGIGIVLLLQRKLPKGATLIIFEAIAPLPVQGILTIEKVDAMRNYISIRWKNIRLSTLLSSQAYASTTTALS